MRLRPRARARRVARAGYHRVGGVGRRLLGVKPPEAVEGGPLGYSDNWPDPEVAPWLPLPEGSVVQCIVCRWQGDAFDGPDHVELSLCPACGANGRDRFLHWCLHEQVELHAGLRMIECSPRMGVGYRAAMSTWYFYRTSDYDMRAHRGNLQLDLQSIALPDACLDVMLCAHVLEHVPDTDKALGELRRVMAPGGHLLLQVPVLQAETAPPKEPEFHGDNTPVFWRFGFDLTDRLREHGFTARLLCTEPLAEAVKGEDNPWAEWSGEFDVPDMLDGARAHRDDLTVVADTHRATRLGLDPAYMYVTWDCTPNN